MIREAEYLHKIKEMERLARDAWKEKQSMQEEITRLRKGLGAAKIGKIDVYMDMPARLSRAEINGMPLMKFNAAIDALLSKSRD